MSEINDLWSSTTDLYERFGLTAESTPPHLRLRFFMEEVLEFVQESTNADPFAAEGEWTLDKVAQEAADVLVTVVGTLQSHGVTFAQFAAAVNAVTAKNDAKTQETHALVNGKITRKQTQP